VSEVLSLQNGLLFLNEKVFNAEVSAVVFVDALAKLFGVLPEPCFAELGDAANVVEMCPSQDVAIRPD
jgi:hypothetical protein